MRKMRISYEVIVVYNCMVLYLLLRDIKASEVPDSQTDNGNSRTTQFSHLHFSTLKMSLSLLVNSLKDKTYHEVVAECEIVECRWRKVEVEVAGEYTQIRTLRQFCCTSRKSRKSIKTFEAR